MNKIYKVMYSKVKQCAVVVSEIAKSHGHNEGRSAVRRHTALTAAVLIALGTFTFMGTPTAQAEDSLKNNDFVGANSTYWYWDTKTNTWKTYDYKLGDAFNNRAWGNLPDYNGAGAKLPGSIAAGLYAQAGQQTITIGDRNAGQSRGSVFIGEHSGYTNVGDSVPAGIHDNYVTAVGFQSGATGWGSIAIGSNAIAENTKKTDTTVNEVGEIGNPKTVSDDVYGIESNPSIEGASVALGYNAHAKDGNIAIGAYSQATEDSSTPYVSVGGTMTNADGSTTPIQRRITNVADGDADSDVATVGQMNKAIESVGATGWTLSTNGSTSGTTIKSGTKVDFSPAVDGKNGTADHSNVAVSNTGSNVKIGLNKDIILGEAAKDKGGSLNVYSDSSDSNNLSNHVKITGSTISVNYPKTNTDGTPTDTRGVIIGVGEDSKGNADGYIAFNNATGAHTYLHSATDAPKDLQDRLEYKWNDVQKKSTQKKYIANLDDGITFTGDVNGKVPEGYTQTPTKLNTTLNIMGGAKTTDDLTSGNIGVVSTPAAEKEDGTTQASKLEIKLNKDLKGITSITSSTTNSTGAKIELGEKGTTISGGDVNVSGSKVTGLKDGENETDAVTVKQLNEAKTALTVKPGWGIEKTDDNTISVKHNLGKNYGNRFGEKGKVTFEADGENALILGGGAITSGDKDVSYGAHAKDSVLLGGMNNTIEKDSEGAIIIGGRWNTASSTGEVQQTGTDTVIVGGSGNKAEGDSSILIGGNNNEATGLNATIIGGSNNTNDGWDASIWGGYDNQITGIAQASGIFGGFNNKVVNNGFTYILGGENNSADGGLAVIVGGGSNKSSGLGSSVFGGADNTATGESSSIIGGLYNAATNYGDVISGGFGNLTSGEYAYAAGGTRNYVTNTEASSFGGKYSSVNGAFSTGVAGGSTGQEAFFSLSAGYQSVVTDGGVEKTYLTGEDANKVLNDMYSGKKLSGYYISDPSVESGPDNPGRLIHYDKFSTALGYQATADEAGTIAFGHDAGDESGYTYEWEQLPKDKDGNQTYANDGTTNDYTKPPKSVKKKDPYTSAYYNRLVKVADGIDDHDVVVMEQLKQYAEKDASNIGNNIKVYKTDANGNVQLDKDKKPIEDKDATTTAQNGSKDDWGQALGAGTFTAGTATTVTNASTSDQLVTGSTLYDYDKPTGSPNYVKVNNTTGQNLSALDAQVKANADELDKPNHNIKFYSVDDKILKYLPKVDTYSNNEANDGTKGMGSMAAGVFTHSDGIASTVAGSYSGVLNQDPAGINDLRGAAALSYGTFNVNQNTEAKKEHSGVANSIIGQVNMTKNSNAAIIYGAGNIVTDSYRPIDEKKAAAILGSVNDPAQLGEAMKDAVKESGGQVMVMGGGNSVDKAYMTQVTGVGNKVSGQDSTYAEGTSTQHNFVDGFQNELSNGKNDYIIGTNNKVSGDSVDKNQSNIIFGDNHKLTNQKNNVIIGSSDEVTEMAGSDAVSIGHNANAGGASVALGSNAVAGGNALAVGPNANAKNNSIALGIHASATSSQNLAIGYYANVTGRPDTIKNSVALGSSSTVGEKDILSTDNEKGVLSIGAKDNERRIIHVRAGVNDTDAVNVSQLKSVQSGLTDKGLTFVTNDGEHTAKLGSKVTIQGTAKKADHEYTADNLTTAIDKDGNITILMDKDMSTEKLTVNGKDGKDGQPGTAGSIGIKGQDGEAGIGIDGKNGISIKGKDGKDGVTMKAVDGKDGTEGHIGLTGPKGTNGKDGTNAIDITVKNGYDGENGINGKNGVDGTSLTRIVYTDKTGEHQVATLEDGLKFKGDDDTVIAKKLNNTLDIIGGANSENLTDGNIGVNSTTDGKLKVQLAKDLTGMNSATYTTTTGEGESARISTTVVNGNGLTINGGPSITNNGIDGGSTVITNVGSGIKTDDAGNITDASKTNAANIGDVDKMVTQAVKKLSDDTKVNLAGKANVDASNLTADDVTKWQEKLGNGKVESGDKGLVTGDTVFKVVDTKANRDGSNLTVDEANKFSEKIAVGKVEADDMHAVSGDAVSKAISKVTGDVNTKLDGKANTSLDNITDGGRNVIRKLAKDSIEMENGNHTTVSSREVDGVKTFKVDVMADGKVESGNKGLISGGTAYTELRPADGSYVKQNSTTAANLTALDKGLKATSDLINTNDKGDIQIGGSSTATKIDVSGKDNDGNTTGRVVTGVVTDVQDASSAANVGYVNGVTAANTQQIYRDMNNAYGRLNNNINKAAAGSNALAALHPLDYDPDDKADFAVGYGHYRNANAAAVGAFYHPNENTMVNVGVSLGNGDPGFNAGVSFKIGSGSAGREAMSKTEMAKVINSQSKEIDALKKDNADKDKRIDALEQKMAEILAKLDKNGK